MSKRRFYIPEIAKGSMMLPDDEARHAISALRLSAGEEVEVFDGKGNLGQATITEVGKREVSLNVNAVEHVSPSAKKLIIATAIPKGKRYQMMVEKCTELGADIIQPVKFERSVSGEKSAKTSRWALEACKQCKRLWLPEIRTTITFDKLTEAYPDASIFVADPQGEKISAKDFSKNNIFLIGPEGGLTEDELKSCDNQSYKIRLADNILRTETAAVAACALYVAMKE